MTMSFHLPFGISHLSLINHLSFIKCYQFNVKSMLIDQWSMLNEPTLGGV